MQAWQLTDSFSIDALCRVDAPDPRPGPGQVVVAMRAASLNYRDLVVVRGGYGSKARLPLIPVSDGVGHVVAVGDGVTDLPLGTRVAGMFFPRWQGGAPRPELMQDSLGASLPGMLAERVVLPASGVARVPDHLGDEEAACLPCAGLTAWNGVIGQGGIQPGDTVLVQGTGGVALFALQFAKLAGAFVVLTSSRDDKLARGRQLGADAIINYRTTADWDRAAKELTGGTGVDLVVEVGGGETIERSIRAVRVGGTINLIGVVSGAQATVPLPLVVMRNVRLQGVTVGSRADFEAMVRAMARHRLRPVIDRIYPFAQAPDALRHLANRGHFGKVCIRF